MGKTKQELELEKLELEVKELRRPVFRRPGFLGAFVPIILAISGLFAAMATGFFDKQLLELKAQRQELTKKIEKSEDELNSLTEQKENLEATITNNNQRISKLGAREKELKVIIKEKEDELEGKDQEWMDAWDIIKFTEHDRDLIRATNMISARSRELIGKLAKEYKTKGSMIDIVKLRIKQYEIILNDLENKQN